MQQHRVSGAGCTLFPRYVRQRTEIAATEQYDYLRNLRLIRIRTAPNEVLHPFDETGCNCQ